MKKILVTGGAGYIGSHAVLALQEQGYRPIVFDNLSEGNADLILPHLKNPKDLVVGDLLNDDDLARVFEAHRFLAVMHFAAKASVAESMQKPELYQVANVEASRRLFSRMETHEVRRIIFSSTAAVYGEPESLPIEESHSLRPINPYGRSKKDVEEQLDEQRMQKDFHYISLRYFNAAGADPKGRIGERHRHETHLVPCILKEVRRAQKAGETAQAIVYGKDYPTRDGTCIRDYVHVSDLAEAHILALEALLRNRLDAEVFNLGTAAGYSVLEIIQAASEVTGVEIRPKFLEKRPGDPASLVASRRKITDVLHWQPKFDDIKRLIETAWQWEQHEVREPPT